MRRIIASIGLILLAMGVAVSAFQTQETYYETSIVKTWNLQLRTLGADNATFYGSFMNTSRWFELNVSCVDPSNFVSVKISFVEQSDEGPIKQEIFDKTGSSFDQKVPISSSGSYLIDIENHNPFPITLEGNVLVNQADTKYRTLYPYAIHGFLIMLGGSSVLIFGFVKPKSDTRSKGKQR